MSMIEVSLVVGSEFINNFEDVLKKCKKVGLIVDSILDSIGVIVGHIDQNKVNKLKKINGIKFTEQARQMTIPSPENTLQ
jgi:hypothetical protein